MPDAARSTRLFSWILVSAFLFFAACEKSPSDPSALENEGPFHGMPYPTTPSTDESPRELIVHLSGGHTIDEMNKAFGTHTVGAIPGTSIYLVGVAPGVDIEELEREMEESDYCYDVDRNHLVHSPESEQMSMAIYEGGFDQCDYADQYALDRIEAAAAQTIARGAGVLVAVIDTGADLDHPDLIDNLRPGYDFIENDNQPGDLPNGIDDNRNGLADEATGHGSHVAGLVALAAPDVDLMPLRVLNSDGIGTAFNVTRAIYHAIDAGAQVINLSLGLDRRVDAMEDAIHEARDEDVLVVASAGNRGIRDEDHFPARLSEVMAIAATNALDERASFSSYGSHISVAAPGERIMSTYWNGGYAIWSGTSMAAPLVAGAAALRLSIAPDDPGHIQRLIENTSTKINNEGSSEDIGKGRVNLFRLVQDHVAGIGLGGAPSLPQ